MLTADQSASAPDIARFYAQFWQSANLSRVEPNDQERRRLDVILGFVTRVLGPAGAPGGRRILDAGCGRGWLSQQLAGWGDVTGIDPVPDAIAIARSLFPGRRFDIAALDVPMARRHQETFDLVVSSEVIEHVLDHADYLRAAAMVLKPGGALVLTTPRLEMYRAFCRIYPRVSQQPVENWISRRQLRHLAKAAGLEHVAEDVVYEVISFQGVWRLLNSVRLNQWLDALPVARIVWSAIRKRWALYYCVLLRKPA